MKGSCLKHQLSNSLWWSIYLINSLAYPIILSHWCSTTVSLQTYPLYSFDCLKLLLTSKIKSEGKNLSWQLSYLVVVVFCSVFPRSLQTLYPPGSLFVGARVNKEPYWTEQSLKINIRNRATLTFISSMFKEEVIEFGYGALAIQLTL